MAVVAMLVATSCASSDHETEVQQEAGPGENVIACQETNSSRSATLTMPDGTERTYRTFIPGTALTTAPMPMVIDFHGAGSNADQQIHVSDFESMAESEGFAVVTPNGIDNRWSSADVGFVDRLLDEVHATGCIDPARVFATGMSNGGFFSSRLACDLAGRIRAIGTVTGISHPNDCSPARAVPIIHFHGTADQIVPYGPIPGEIAAWAAALGCGQPTLTFVTPDIERSVHADCEDGAVVDFYSIDDAGHTWPGSAETQRFESTLGVTNVEINATELIWAFFESQTTERTQGSTETTGSDAIEASYEEGQTSSGLRYRVALPANYDPNAGYPVLYHLHGASQTWDGLQRDVEASAAMLHQGAVAGLNEPTIVVAPFDDTGWSMWTDSFDGTVLVRTQLVEELIAEAEADYAVSQVATARSIQGFSMGGFGAASIGLSHPDLFSSVIIWDGAMHDWQTLSSNREHISEDQFDSDESYFEQWSPWSLATERSNEAPAIMLVSGSLTSYYETYRDHLGATGPAPVAVEAACGHDFSCLTLDQGQAAMAHLGENTDL